MHFWRLSYQDVRALPIPVYRALGDYQRRWIREVEKQTRRK
jgi:hypothetical protein